MASDLRDCQPGEVHGTVGCLLMVGAEAILIFVLLGNAEACYWHPVALAPPLLPGESLVLLSNPYLERSETRRSSPSMGF